MQTCILEYGTIYNLCPSQRLALLEGQIYKQSENQHRVGRYSVTRLCDSKPCSPVTRRSSQVTQCVLMESARASEMKWLLLHRSSVFRRASLHMWKISQC